MSLKIFKAVGKSTDNTYMDNKDRRKFPRVAIFDPISFTCTDSKDNVLEEDIGVALNACQNGIQIESFRKIESEFALVRFVDLEMKNIEIKGKVIYSRKTESGVFKTGIRLLASHEILAAYFGSNLSLKPPPSVPYFLPQGQT
jgi:hypothetical protein